MTIGFHHFNSRHTVIPYRELTGGNVNSECTTRTITPEEWERIGPPVQFEKGKRPMMTNGLDLIARGKRRAK